MLLLKQKEVDVVRKITIKFFVALFVISMLTACQSDKVKTQVEDGKEETKEEKLNKKIDVNENLEFEQFNIEFKSVKAYEKDDKLLLDINFSWRNRKLPDGSTLFVATLFEVIQNNKELEEINNHWNPEGDRSLQNDVFSSNAVGGLSPVKLTYELDNKADNVKLIFTPTTETEDSQTITIELD